VLSEVAAEEKGGELVENQLRVIEGSNRLKEATGERAIRAGEGADGCNRAVSKELVAVSCAAQERLGIPWKCGKRQASTLDQRRKGREGGDAHMVASTLERLSKRDKRLDIAARAERQDGDLAPHRCPSPSEANTNTDQ
jgi:hypothetical protein